MARQCVRGAPSPRSGECEFRGKLFDTFIATGHRPVPDRTTTDVVGAGGDGLDGRTVCAGWPPRRDFRHGSGTLHGWQFVPGGSRLPTQVAAQVIAEGVCLANFDGGAYKTNDDRWGWTRTSRDQPARRAEGAGRG
jgi:hypothetical protein